MKYVILVPDGMAGLPLEELNDRTCMEAANSPYMDTVAKNGIVGLANNVPRGMTPASDVANLSILGYDPKKYYCGRGPLEAANLGVEITDSDIAFRFNTITVSSGNMADYSAGHISTKEAQILVEELNKKMASKRFSFYAGTSYRNLAVMHCVDHNEAREMAKLKCYPPHDILSQPIKKYLPKNIELVELMERSKKILAEQDINKVRVDLGQNPANMIWFWGQGRRPDMPTLKEAYGISGGIISAVDLLKGTGKVLGMEVANVEGATGYYDTNYEGKARAAMEILNNNDMVFVHVEAPDEAGHNGHVREKIKAIENFDSKIVKFILESLQDKEDYRVLILPDHPTPVKLRTHTADAVPFAMAGKGIEPDSVTVFNEKSAKAGSAGVREGHTLMNMLLGKE